MSKEIFENKKIDIKADAVHTENLQDLSANSNLDSNANVGLDIEEIKYYNEHLDEIKRKERQEHYATELERVGKYLAKHYYPAKLLVQNGYQIFDLHQANEDFRNLLGLDKIEEVAGVYKTIKDGKHLQNIVSIRKNNFYNGFYPPIWKNLSVSERVKVLEWYCETMREERNLDLKLTYFPDTIKALSNEGQFASGELFININDIAKNQGEMAFEYLTTLAHELTHSRQHKFAMSIKNPHISMTLYEYALYNAFVVEYENSFDNLLKSLKLTEDQKYAIYQAQKEERVAELMSAKTLKKFCKLNEQRFGKNKSVQKMLKSTLNKILFPSLEFSMEDGESVIILNGSILESEEIFLKGNQDILLKLIMLINLKNYNIDYYKDIKTEIIKQSEETGENIDKYQVEDGSFVTKTECIEKIKKANKEIENAKTLFKQIIDSGEVPKHFDEKIFEDLDLIEEEVSAYALPKWLRKEEAQYRKRAIKVLSEQDENDLLK